MTVAQLPLWANKQINQKKNKNKTNKLNEKKNKNNFNPFTQCKYTCSLYFFLYISQAADKETLMNNQELL